MADSERLTTGGGEAGDAAKRREELDQLLQRIATHIAQVDKLGDGAEADGDAAGPEQTGALPRDRDWEFEPKSGDPIVEPDDWLVVSGDDASEKPALRRDMSGDEPPALRSAIRGSDEAQPDGVETQLPREGAEQSAAQGDEPWDRAAAEALTQTYEADASVPPLRSMLNLMVQTEAAGVAASRSVGRAGGRAGASYQNEISHAEIDAAQTRLFEAAQRVESMLDSLAPREVVEALDGRFTTLEAEVRRSGDQLARLDGIEHRLGELSEKLTDEQVLHLFGSLVPTAEELTQFAEDAAGRAAERVLEAHVRDAAPSAPGSQSAPAVTDQLTSLGDLVGRFMDERRRNDAGTLEALETLQLAMQHVLDRIDRAEARIEPAQAPLAEHNVAVHRLADDAQARSPLLADDQADVDEPSGELINLTANQNSGARDLTAESYSMPEDSAPALVRQLGTQPQGPSRSHRRIEGVVAPGGDEAAFDGLPTVPPARREPQSDAGLAAGDEPAPNDRQAFIAMARKAAERAKAQSEPSSNLKPEASGQAKVRAGVPLVTAASKGVIRPGVLLVAVAALLMLAGYWFFVGHKHSLLWPSASVEVGQEPAATAAAAAHEAAPERGAEDAAATAGAATADNPTQASPAAPSEETAAPAPSETRQGASLQPAETTAPGMAVSFGNSPVSFDAVMQARERSRLASLSQRAAYHAASANRFVAHSAPLPVAAAPAAPARPNDTSAIETSSTAGVPAMQRSLNLPPAATGPLSLRMAAAEGDAVAQIEIASRLAEGRGVRQNFAEAARWYERAAEQGHAIAQYRLATLFERGMGVKADRAKAQALYEKAAEQGNLKAMHNLGVIITSASAPTPDYMRAARLFSRAAQHGLNDSQYNLAVLYESGLGVSKDHSAAYKWYALAARSGDTLAARRRDALISRLPPETIQAMDAQLASWQAAPADEAANNPRAVGNISRQNGDRSGRR